MPILATVKPGTIPEDLVQWVCPYCDEQLPICESRWQKELSVKRHIDQCNKCRGGKKKTNKEVYHDRLRSQPELHENKDKAVREFWIEKQKQRRKSTRKKTIRLNGI